MGSLAGIIFCVFGLLNVPQSSVGGLVHGLRRQASARAGGDREQGHSALATFQPRING